MCQGELKNYMYLQIGPRSMVHTGWKLKNFPFTQILRETKVGDFCKPMKMQKMEVFELPESQKLISRKIRVTEKS